MRSITSFALHSILAAALVAFAASSAAAAVDAFLKLDPVKGELAKGEQIEVQSFHWGPRQTTSADGSIEQAGEKRQHSPVTFSKPLDRGTLTVRGSLPGCTVGKRYSGAQFASANMRYELKDVVISSCAADGVSLTYAKVTVRGWDPAVKHE